MHRVSRRLLDAAERRHHQPLVSALAVVSAGIVVDRYWPPPLWAWPTIVVTALALALVLRMIGRTGWGSLMLFVAIGGTGGAWHHVRWYEFAANDLGHFAGETPRSMTLEARVVDAPRIVVRTVAPSPHEGYFAGIAATKTRFELEAVRASFDGEWIDVAGRADYEVTGKLEGVEAGDRVTIDGTLFATLPPANPGEFDFAEHYRAERKLCVVRSNSPAGVTVTARRSPLDLRALSAQWRRRSQQVLLENLPAQQAPFASALLLGYRDQMERRENWAFFRTGTVHVLSISGLHIGILALGLHWALRLGWLPRKTAIWVTMIVTVAYAVIIDAEPPALRAALVVVLASWGALIGRRALSFNVLAGSALVVLAFNPCELFRAGPQLSFLAAAVLASFAQRKPEIDDDDPIALVIGSRTARFAKLVGKFSKRTVTVSAAIFVVTTPLVAFRFHILSPIALLLTPLLAVPVAVALFAGFLTLIVGALVPPLAVVPGVVCGWMLQLVGWTVETTQHWPGAAVWLPGPAFGQIVAFYLFAVVFVLLPYAMPRFRCFVGGAACVWCVAIMIPRYELPTHVEARVTFISVGHGLAVLIEGRDGDSWLYDCGSNRGGEYAGRSIAAVLWSRGITRLEGVVISHADTDHYDALPFVLEQFRVGGVYCWATMLDGTSDAGNFIRDEAARRGVPLRAIVASDRLPVSTAAYSAEVLYPPPRSASRDDNDDSVVLLVEAAGNRVLLTGDIAGRGLAAFLQLPPPDCDVLSVPHHGSQASKPAEVAERTKPEWAIISDGPTNREATAAAYSSGGAEVLNTSTAGAITITFSTDELTVQTFRHIRRAAER